MFKIIAIIFITFSVQISYAENLYVQDEQATNNAHESSKIIDQISGVYKKPSIDMEGIDDDGPFEDILEIVKVNDNIIYFRTRSHSRARIGALWGTAIYIGNNLFIYKGEEGEDDSECQVAIEVTEKDIEFINGYADSNQCEYAYWGGGGSFEKSMRRPIKYMKRLKNSTKYKNSIEKLNK